MKICPVRAELFHADGHTDRHDEANSRFSQFCETPLNCLCKWISYIKGFSFELLLHQSRGSP